MQVTLQIGESTTVVQPVAAGKQLGIRACGYPDGTVAVVVKQLDGTVVASRDFTLESMSGPYWLPVADGTWMATLTFSKGTDNTAYGLADVVEV
jgi:hypothetical protein